LRYFLLHFGNEVIQNLFGKSYKSHKEGKQFLDKFLIEDFSMSKEESHRSRRSPVPAMPCRDRDIEQTTALQEFNGIVKSIIEFS
jgi:hypothetical protein